MNPLQTTNGLQVIHRVAFWAMVLVSLKVFAAILYQYRWYLPPDFDASPFLSGRRFTFTGLYRAAFYVHLVVSPVALILGTFLIASGGKVQWRRTHRKLGKLQFLVITTAVVPSGILMAMQAYAGPIAELGFIVQSLLTGVTVIAAAIQAGAGQIAAHRRWAIRCYLLLWSPLLLRLIAGVLIVFELESEWTYRLNAWLSWLVPLLIYETRLHGSFLLSPKVRNHECA